MAAKNQVELAITARNEASGALDRAFQDMDRSRRGAVEFGQAFGQLNPILAQTIFRITDFTQATRGIDVGLRASVITIGLLTAGFAAYARALQSSIAAQVAFNQALHSADIGTLRSQLAGINTELDLMAETLSKVGSNEGFAQAFRNVVGLILAAPAALSELLGFTKPPEIRQRETMEKLVPLLQIQGARERAESEAKFRGGEMQRIQMEQARLAGLGLSGRSREFLSPQIEATAAQQLAAQLEAIRIAEQEALAKALTGPAAGPEAELIRGRFADQRRLLRQAAQTAGAARAIGIETETREERQADNAIEVERLNLARDRLALTAAEKASMDLLVIEHTRLLELDRAGGNERKKALADFRAQAETAAKLREEFERTDLAGGIGKGFREIREHFTSFGEAGADAVRRFASTAERTMSDLFFMPIERGWKKTFEELPRQVGLSMLRILTDTFARVTLGRLLGGGTAGLGALGLPGISLPGVGPGVAQAGAINVTGASAQQLQQLQAAGYQVATNQAGQSFALPTPGVGTVQGYMPGGVQSFLNTPVWGSTSGAAAYSAAGLTPMIGPGGELLFTTTSGTVLSEASATALMATTAEQGSTAALASSMNYGQVLGYAGMVVAAGFAAYSAYQSGSPAQGAMTGATTGLMIGAYFGPWGAVIGLVVGAAVGAGLGALGKKSPSHKEREAREIGRAQGAVQQDIARVRAARLPEDLVEAIRSAMHEAFGGPAGRGQSPDTAGFAIMIAGRSVRFGGPYGATMTTEEFSALLFAQPETFLARIQLGINEDAKRQINEAFEGAVRNQVAVIMGEVSQVLFGFDERLAVPGLGGGVTRTTILPVSRAAEARGRGPLMVLGDSLLGLDDETKAKLLMELARVNDQMDLQILRVEESGVRVTVGRWTPAPLPPPQPAPAPAPASAVPASEIPNTPEFFAKYVPI